MSCIINRIDGPVFVSHNPIAVFTTTQEHLAKLHKKPDGHYDREELHALVKQGHAVHYDEKAVRAISAAAEFIIFGCPRY